MRAIIANHGGRLLSPNRGQLRLDLHRRGERLVVQDLQLDQCQSPVEADAPIAGTPESHVPEFFGRECHRRLRDRNIEDFMELHYSNTYGVGGR
jgi:hypothetical protein